MNIALTKERLTENVTLSGDVLTLPKEGGGITLDELKTARQRYLNLEMEVLQEHSMAFELRVYGSEDAPRVIVRFGLMPRFPAGIGLDLNLLDGHILFPGHTVGELKVVCHGSRIDRSEITRATLVSMAASHPVRVRLSDISLCDAPPAPAPLPKEKLIDELGQYIPKSWEGKQPSAEAATAAIRKNADLPEAYPYADWTRYGGSAAHKLMEGTGYFTRVKQDGRWYLCDPDGCAFFSVGPDCVNIRPDSRVDGLESLMTWLPGDGDELIDASRLRFGETDRGQAKLVSFMGANLRRAFGENWRDAWRNMAIRQLKNAGMNTLGNWSDPSLFGRMPYVTSLPRFPETKHTIFRDFPDVFSPEYGKDALVCAEALKERRNDPYMIGYFLRNEPGWAFVDHLLIAEETLRDPQETCSKRALIGWLKDKYMTPAALSEAWGHAFSDWNQLLKPIANAASLSRQAEADLRAFSREMLTRYTSIPAKACRAVDGNHMILGMRWAWISDPDLAAGWESFDVFSINCYAVDPTEAIAHVVELGVDLPVMIGEFHFGALDAGLTATGLEAVPSQEERGVAYRHYCERVAAHPCGVGCHYFQCYDQFALGRFDGENYNIGLFDVCLQPYEKMIAASLALGKTLYDVSSGLVKPYARKPASLPMIAY